jgi:hypothetical protein
MRHGGSRGKYPQMLFLFDLKSKPKKSPILVK